MTAPTTETKWLGWYRHDARSPWRVIVTADDETAALNQLLDRIPGGDKCVLLAGTNPNDDAPTIRRRRF